MKTLENDISKRQDNTIAIFLKIIGVATYITGFIGGFILGNIELGTYYRYTKLSWPVVISIWIAAIISGTFTIGFGEIISLLEAIKQNGLIDSANYSNKNTMKTNIEDELPDI